MLTQLLSRATVEGSDGLWQDAAGSDFERSSSCFALVLVARATNRVGYSVVDWPSQRHALICYMPTGLHMTAAAAAGTQKALSHLSVPAYSARERSLALMRGSRRGGGPPHADIII